MTYTPCSSPVWAEFSTALRPHQCSTELVGQDNESDVISAQSMSTSTDKHRTTLDDLPFEILTQVIHYLPHSKWVDSLAQAYNRHIYNVCLPTLLIRRRIPAAQRAIFDAFELSWFGYNPWNYDSGQLDHLADDPGGTWPHTTWTNLEAFTTRGDQYLPS